MKRLAIAMLLSSLCVSAADVSGRWTGTAEATRDDGSTTTNEATFSLKQEGKTVTGTGGGTEESFPVRKGTIDGNILTLEFDAGERGVFKLTLTVNGDTMTGN